MNKRIYLSPPHMGQFELKYVEEAFESNWVSPAGPHLDAFEQELCTYNNVPFCVALASGTSAIHLALILIGVKGGDEVLCSSFTFAGSCNPIVYQGATPVFIDSEDKSWNMDPVLLEEAIQDRIRKGKKPKAIIVVHLYGMPALISEIVSIARKYDIPLIEDAAEAIGSMYHKERLGSFGDMAVFSFNGNKIITTSGGGALVSRNEQWIKMARFLSTQARDTAPHYQHSMIGYNYRLSNISAAIGRGQLKVLDKRIERRRAIYEYYTRVLGGIPGLSFQLEFEGAFSNRWLTTILIDPAYIKSTREDLRLLLERHNIESRPLWKPMHLQPVFKHAPFYGSGVSEFLFDRGLCVPSGSSLSDEELDKICSIIIRQLCEKS